MAEESKRYYTVRLTDGNEYTVPKEQIDKYGWDDFSKSYAVDGVATDDQGNYGSLADGVTPFVFGAPASQSADKAQPAEPIGTPRDLDQYNRTSDADVVKMHNQGDPVATASLQQREAAWNANLERTDGDYSQAKFPDVTKQLKEITDQINASGNKYDSAALLPKYNALQREYNKRAKAYNEYIDRQKKIDLAGTATGDWTKVPTIELGKEQKRLNKELNKALSNEDYAKAEKVRTDWNGLLKEARRREKSNDQYTRETSQATYAYRGLIPNVQQVTRTRDSKQAIAQPLTVQAVPDSAAPASSTDTTLRKMRDTVTNRSATTYTRFQNITDLKERAKIAGVMPLNVTVTGTPEQKKVFVKICNAIREASQGGFDNDRYNELVKGANDGSLTQGEFNDVEKIAFDTVNQEHTYGSMSKMAKDLGKGVDVGTAESVLMQRWGNPGELRDVRSRGGSLPVEQQAAYSNREAYEQAKQMLQKMLQQKGYTQEQAWLATKDLPTDSVGIRSLHLMNTESDAMGSIIEPFLGKALDQAIANAQRNAEGLFEAYEKGMAGAPSGAMAGMELMQTRAYNKERSPEVLVAALTRQIDAIARNPKLQKAVRERAEKAGLTVDSYNRAIVLPKIASMIEGVVQRSEMARNMPKGDVDYIVRNALRGSILGNLYLWATQTGSQNQIEDAVLQKYAHEHQSISNELWSTGLSLVIDAGPFAALGAAAGALTSKVLPPAVQKLTARGLSVEAATRVNASKAFGARIIDAVPRNMLSTTAVLEGYSLGQEGVHQMANRQFDSGALAATAGKTAVTSTILGGVGGTTAAATFGLAGIRKGVGKVLGFGAEANAFALSDYLVNNPNGESYWKILTKDAMMLPVMKVTSPGTWREIGEMWKHPRTVLRSERFKQGGIQFTRQEREEISKAGGQKFFDAISQAEADTSRWRSAGEEREISGETKQRLADNYAKLMNDPNVSFPAKQKIALICGGNLKLYRPLVQNYRSENGGRTVATLDKDGNVIDRITFKDNTEAGAYKNQLNGEIGKNRESGKALDAFGAAIGDMVRDMDKNPAIGPNGNKLTENQVLNVLYGGTTGDAKTDYAIKRRFFNELGKYVDFAEEPDKSPALLGGGKLEAAEYMAGQAVEGAEKPLVRQRYEQAQQNLQTNPDDATAKEEYVAAKAAYTGMIDGARDDVEQARKQAEAEVEATANKDTGTIQEATTTKGEKVNVVRGTLARTKSGDVDTEKSSPTIVVKNTETGETSMVPPTAIDTIDNETPTDEVKKRAGNQAAQAAAEQAAAEIDAPVERPAASATEPQPEQPVTKEGRTEKPIKVGDVFNITDQDGANHRIEVTENHGPYLSVLADGAPMSMSTEQLAQMAGVAPAQPEQPAEPQKPIAEQPKQEEKKAKSKWVDDADAERFEELRRRLRQKLGGQLNMGVDPEAFALGVEMSYLMLKHGARKFAEFAKQMIEALGENVRPYLKSFYNGARDLPEMAEYEKELTPYDEVRTFDVMNFDKEGAKDIVATAEHIVREQAAEREAKEATDKLKQERNEQRKETEQEVAANTEALASEEPLKPTSNEEVHVQTRPGTPERESGHQRGQNEPLGESQPHEDERADARRVAGRGGNNPQSDTSRGTGVSERPVSERPDGSQHVKPAKPEPAPLKESERKNTHNNHVERGMDYAPKGVNARIEANIKAIETMQRLIENGEKATPEDMEVLRRFSGWGGLGAAFKEKVPGRWRDEDNPINKRLRELLSPEAYEAANMSRNSAYYTPAPVIDAMWDVARAMGFRGGNVLEGSAGIGNIIGLMPTDMSERSNIHAVEIDETTGNILSLLYPDANVEVKGFEKTFVPNGSVDLAITNVPFVTGLRVKDETGDKDLSRKFHDIHDFCIAKNVRKLREGGIGIFITSSGTLDSPNSAKLRSWITNEGNADVVGAFRMNNETFGGTGATSDIIVIRKRVNGQKSANAIDIGGVDVIRTAEYDDGMGKKNSVKQLALDVNKYFVEHPENMGGEMHFAFEKGDTYRATSKALYPKNGIDQNQRLAEWASQFKNMDWDEAAKPESQQVTYENLGDDVKEGSMLIDKNGNLCLAQRGQAVPIKVNANKVKGHTKADCFRSYKAIKDALDELLQFQTEHDDDGGLKQRIDALNRTYDRFVNTYGHLNKNTAISFLRNDMDFPSIAALESVKETGDKSGKRIVTYGKTDIFTRRVVEKESEPRPTNIKDGIIASIYLNGRVDVPYIAEQLGISEDEVRADIVKSGLGFENPATTEMEVSYEYLSGNVREKLRQAKENNTDGRYDANIKALERVIPMDIPAHLIEFTIGSSWIEPKLYEDYVKARTGLDVKLTNAGGTWIMQEPWNTNTEQNKAMGVISEICDKTILGHELIRAAMQNKTIRVSKTEKHYDGTTETIVDKDASIACANKVDEIRQDFKDWARQRMQADPAMSERMERVYNDQFNNSIPKEIPDDFVPEHFGGAATVVNGKPFQLRPHQAKAVIRATTQPLMLAHEVGTGKTYTLITTAMEMRRLGTARKPMIVVQNATVGQFVASAKALYPNAKILTLEDADRNAEGRRNFYAKIRYNDWDMIVIPQSVFERIPDSEERQIRFIEDKVQEKMMVLEKMREASTDGDRDPVVRQAQRELDQLNEELNDLKLTMKERKKSSDRDEKREAKTRQNAAVRAQEMLDRAVDDVANFDDLGVDALLIDEAHEYKHLGFATAMQRGVKGVDPSYSKKSQGVFLKTQAVLENNNGHNVVFATGTPISNTAAEIWTFMRYLMPKDTMQEYGIYYFDDFVRNFGNIQQMLEFQTNGKYKENNRFAGYVNLPELERIWLQVADIVLTREAGGVSDKIPKMEGGKAQDVFLPQTKALRSVMKFVKAQLDDYEKMSGKEKKENSHIPLVMYGIAKAAAVDARLVLEDAADEPNSKTNEAVRQTLRSLEDTKEYNGTVAIFADNYQNKATGFNLYEDIRKKLIEAGVPAEQVVVIKSGMSVKKKLEIFDKVNRGEVRVIMGSTFTLGTGVNIQERLHTLINIDAPNRPMDYTQRLGRLLRQGNLHNVWGKPVRVLRFGVEDSLDVTAYQRLKTKGAIADSIMEGKKMMSNSMENRVLEEEQDLFGDITAQLSGSQYALLKNQVEKEVKKLEARKKQWEADQTYVHNQKPRLKALIKDSEERAKRNKEALAKVEAAKNDGITIGKMKFPSLDAMGDYIKDYNSKQREQQEQVRTASGYQAEAKSDLTVSVGGFDFHIHRVITKERKQDKGQLTLSFYSKTQMTYSCPELGLEDVPVEGQRLKSALEDIMGNVMTGNDFRERMDYAQRSVERYKGELQQVEARDGKPFEYAEDLKKAKEKLAEYEKLMKEEMAAKEAKYKEMDANVEAANDVRLSDEDDSEGEDTASYRIVDDPIDVARDMVKREELGLGDDTALYRDPSETEDIWSDQSMGMQERITAAATRLANNHQADKTLRNDATRKSIFDQAEGMAKRFLESQSEKMMKGDEVTESVPLPKDADVSPAQKVINRFNELTQKGYHTQPWVIYQPDMSDNSLIGLLGIENWTEGLTPEEIHEEVEGIRESLENNERLLGFHSPFSGNLVIFANRIPEKKIDETFFHENVHHYLKEESAEQVKNLQDYVWDNFPERDDRASKEYIKKNYASKNWKEEFLINWLGKALAYGEAKELLAELPETYHHVVTNILKKIGYNERSEKEQREHWQGLNSKEETFTGKNGERSHESARSNLPGRMGGTPKERKLTFDQLLNEDEEDSLSAHDEQPKEGADEELKNFDAGHKTLGEIITDGLIEASKRNKDNLALRIEAMKSIGGNLSTLRKAMAKQRAYDRTTVNDIVRMARTIIDSGNYNSMTRGEVKRLLSLVKQAAGREDITGQAGKVVDLLIKHQVDQYKYMLHKQVKTKGSKIDARGVTVQDGLDISGQRTMKALREGMSMDGDELKERLAEISDRVGSDDPVVASNASAEWEGLLLAQQYYDGVKKSETDYRKIEQELRDTKASYSAGEMTRKEWNEYRRAAEDAKRKNMCDRMEAYERLITNVSLDLNQSWKRAQAFKEENKRRVAQIHHFANSDLEGKRTDEHMKPNVRMQIQNWALVRLLNSPLATFDYLLRFFGGKSPRGEGYLWDFFITHFVNANDDEWRNFRRVMKELDAKVSEVFGKKMKWSNLYSMEKHMPGMEVQFYDGEKLNADGKMVPDKKGHMLTQGEMLYIYMVNKMPDGKMKLRKMGISEDDVTAIKGSIHPNFIKLADWMQEEMLPKLRARYNEVYERMFGASMADIENYFPFKINKRGLDTVIDIGTDNEHGDTKPSTITGALIERKRTTKAFDIMNADAFDIMAEHVQQMEHWAAWAEFSRDINTLLNYKRFRNRVLNMGSWRYGSGKQLWNTFKDVCRIAADVYHPRTIAASVDSMAVNLSKGWTMSRISWRPYTALKQLLSYPAYMSEASIVELAKSSNPKGVFTSWEWALKTLPGFAERWQSRTGGDNRLAKTDVDWRLWNSRVGKIFSHGGMIPNAFVDAITVAMGAKAIYETRKKQYIHDGFSEPEAHRLALRDAAVSYNETQQSSQNAYLSPMQLDRTFYTTVYTTFRNSPMGYERRYMQAFANMGRMLKPGYRKESEAFMKKKFMRMGLNDEQAESASKRAYRRSWFKNIADSVIFGHVLQFFWDLGPSIPLLFFGGDDDKKKDAIKGAAIQSASGPVEGLTGGDVMADVYANIIEGKGSQFQSWELMNMPMSDDVKRLYYNLTGKNGDPVRAANDIFNMLSYTTLGVNPQTMTDWMVAIMDASDDPETQHETALLVMRLLEVPQSTLDQIYIDELGMSARQASRLTADQFANRYAKYKIAKNAPLTSWMYSNWDRREVELRYIKQFEKRRKELIGMGDSPEVNDILQEYKDGEYKNAKLHVDWLKLQEQTNPENFQRDAAAFRQTPEYMHYMVYNIVNRRINKMYIQGMYDQADTLKARLSRALQAQSEEEIGNILYGNEH